MKKVFYLAIAISALLTSCKKDKVENKEKVFKGPFVQFQHGKAWSWYEVDNNDNPYRLAIAIDDSAMATLDRNPPGGAGHHHENMISLVLPAKAAATPFMHAGLDWNPVGHEPIPIYGKPHFDFHFYMMSEADRMAIPPYELDSLKFKNFPAPAYFPLHIFPLVAVFRKWEHIG
jgi:hypothetical protein